MGWQVLAGAGLCLLIAGVLTNNRVYKVTAYYVGSSVLALAYFEAIDAGLSERDLFFIALSSLVALILSAIYGILWLVDFFVRKKRSVEMFLI